MNETIYAFIKRQEADYQKPIQLEDGWSWSMKDHIRQAYLLKHSQFLEDNDNRDTRPFKNIIKPILNIQYRTEGFDVKDIDIYVENPENYYKSFLVKKYHDKWALENSVDTFIDSLVESYVDYGGVLARNTASSKPEIVSLRRLCFCNQNNILVNPFGIKHILSPAQLRKMKKWGTAENGATVDMETFITLTREEEKIEVYEVQGELPKKWIEGDSKDYVQQMQVVAYYKDQNKQEVGVTLFAKEIPDINKIFKFLSRDNVDNRALGTGGVEELFEDQVWSNFDEIKITEILEAVSKVLYKTTDPSFKTKNNLRNTQNMEVLTITQGNDISQIDNYPRNLALFNDALVRWEQHAQQIGAASEGLLGEEPKSGVPFKLYEAQNVEAKSMHIFRQGQIATFVEEIYREWFLPRMAKELVNDQTFLAELSADEMISISEKIAIKAGNNYVKQKILSGKIPVAEEMEEVKQTAKVAFTASGSKKFIKMLKKDFANEPLGISTSIVGKQKNLALMTDKIVSLVRQFLATPELRQDPEMIKLLNTILESSGMSPMIFGASTPMQPMQPQTVQGTTPLRDLATAQQK